MPTGTIQAVTSQKPWSGKHGDFIDFTLTLDPGGEVIITRKVMDGATKPLLVGELLTYEIKGSDQFGTKIKEVDPERAGNGNATPASPTSSARQDSIERQVAAKCAAEVVAALSANGKLASSDAIGDAFDKLTNKFHVTIRGYTVEKVDPANNIAAESLPPADTTTSKPDPDDEIPF